MTGEATADLRRPGRARDGHLRRDVAALADALDLEGAHSRRPLDRRGEVARYVARARPGRVSKAVLIGAVPPVMVSRTRTRAGCRSKYSTASARPGRHRAQFYFDVPAGPFYGFIDRAQR